MGISEPLDLKLVSVKFDAFALALPTLNFGFYPHIFSCKLLRYSSMQGHTWKSFCFSFFFLELEPIVTDLLIPSEIEYARMQES